MKKTLAALIFFSLLLGACEKDVASESDSSEQKEISKKNEQPSSENDNKNLETSLSTGESIDKNKDYNSFAIMVENSEAARPHSGLIKADVVYEMEVEAEITRFMAVFHDNLPELVGPVRSSRDYYIPIAQEWNTPYIHFGGSPDAYTVLQNLELTHIDGITQGTYFTRDNSRVAPHNAYLHTDRLPKFSEEIKNEHFKFDNVSYKNEASANTIEFSYNSFTDVKYSYDKQTKKYMRFLEGSPHKDREMGEQISVTNVIIQYADHKTIVGDDKGRIDIDLESGNKAIYFTNGKKIEGFWSNENGTTKFYDNDGYRIILNPGNTWIQVVKPNEKINVN